MSSSAQFASIPNKGTPATLTAANTALTGTGATGRALIFTAGANGAILPFVQGQHLGTNSNPGVVRFFRNNGSDPEVADNNSLIREFAFAANTLSQTAESVPLPIPLNLRMAGGERIYAMLSVAAAAGIRITPINGADF
jgi:hypothetical protein